MTSKFQKNICFKVRAVGLINIKYKNSNVKVVAIYESGLWFRCNGIKITHHKIQHLSPIANKNKRVSLEWGHQITKCNFHSVQLQKNGNKA